MFDFFPTTDGIGNFEGVEVKDPRNSGGKGGLDGQFSFQGPLIQILIYM